MVYSLFVLLKTCRVIMKNVTQGCFYMHNMLHGSIKLSLSRALTLAVIAVSVQTDLPCSLYVFTGTGNRTRIIDITKVSSALGTSVCSALIGIHTFSGCDSTSGGKGKRKTFSVACEKDEYLKAFTSLGTNFNLEQSTFALLCRYVCHLYDQP